MSATTLARWLGRMTAGVIACGLSCRSALAIGPSDCLPGHADSTCAAALNSATATVRSSTDSSVLYDGLLAQGPYGGYEYWGYDFLAAAQGRQSSVYNDMFINNSGTALTLVFAFNIPTDRPCGRDCIPGVEFKLGATWQSVFPTMEVSGGTATATFLVGSGQSYGWIIGLWEPSDIHLTVTTNGGTRASLGSAGLSLHPEIADPVPPTTYTCNCGDGTVADCSKGTRYSNGLMGPWNRENGGYWVPDAWSNCAFELR